MYLNDFVKNDTKNFAVWSSGKYINLKSGNYVEHQTFSQYYREQYNRLSRDAKRNLNRGTDKERFKEKQKENYEAAIKDKYKKTESWDDNLNKFMSIMSERPNPLKEYNKRARKRKLKKM